MPRQRRPKNSQLRCTCRGPYADPDAATIAHAGVEVTIAVGEDGVPVVWVDTPGDETNGLEFPCSDDGPELRIRLNEIPVYIGADRRAEDAARAARQDLEAGS